MAQTAWKRFHVPEFDHRSLKGMTFNPPEILASDKAAEIAAAANSGDAAAGGAYGVEPDAALLDKLSFGGDVRQMIQVAMPGAHKLVRARSYAWNNQRSFILDGNAADAEVIHNWRTGRPNNTRLGPDDDGTALEQSVIYLLSGRILEDGNRGNRVIVDADWNPGDGRAGVRVMAACDSGDDNFHDSYFEFSWDA